MVTWCKLSGDLLQKSNIMVGDLKVPKGKYTVFTLPTKTGWTLIINKIPEQWGAFNYSQDKDLGRTKMTVKTVAAPVEQFTLTLSKTTLKLAWDTTEASVAICRGERAVVALARTDGAGEAATGRAYRTR